MGEEMRSQPRDLEFVLGLIGGITGLLGSLLYIYFTFSLKDSYFAHHFLPGSTRGIASIIAIWMAYKVQYEAKKAGAIFIISGVWLFFLENVTKPSGIILVVVGFLCLYRK
ncbi:DUF4064 domain-containing protein [Virgibacillus sp. FSP13]